MNPIIYLFSPQYTGHVKNMNIKCNSHIKTNYHTSSQLEVESNTSSAMPNVCDSNFDVPLLRFNFNGNPVAFTATSHNYIQTNSLLEVYRAKIVIMENVFEHRNKSSAGDDLRYIFIYKTSMGPRIICEMTSCRSSVVSTWW